MIAVHVRCRSRCQRLTGATAATVDKDSLSGRVANIPTWRELGYPHELFGIWFSFLAPAGIAEDARKVLVGRIEQAVKDPAIAAPLAPLSIVQSYAGPEPTAAEIRDELKRVSAMARKTGLVK